MSAAGSYYGWIYPTSLSKEEVLSDFVKALETCGLRLVGQQYNRYFDFEGSLGFQAKFDLDMPIHEPRAEGHLIYARSHRLHFRPLDLIRNPEDREFTQKGYDFVKLVFDRSKATEAFGFYAMQSNAVSLEDSNVNFFFLKTGPQLVLRHLEERRNLQPEEIGFHSLPEPEFERTIGWDDELHSDFFTRFTSECADRIIRTYDLMNDLVRLPWKEFYQEHSGK